MRRGQQKNKRSWRLAWLLCPLWLLASYAQAQETSGGVANVPQKKSNSVFDASAHQRLRNGDQSYRKGDFAKAETEYRKAIDRKPSPKGQYNLGNAIYQQKRFPEAIQHYNAASQTAQVPEDRSSAYYNLGNAQFQAGKYEESINAYKNSLRQNPGDLESKFNLAVAQKKLEQKQKEQQQQQQQKNQNQQNQQQQPQKNQQQQNQQNQQNQQQKDQNEKAQAEPDTNQKLSRKEAENLLKIMEDEERKVQSKLKRGFTTPAKSYKDW
jgi:tetratricopeptide (TPR) repeat protein